MDGVRGVCGRLGLPKKVFELNPVDSMENLQHRNTVSLFQQSHYKVGEE
jgi:hypothetical protein